MTLPSSRERSMPRPMISSVAPPSRLRATLSLAGGRGRGVLQMRSLAHELDDLGVREEVEGPAVLWRSIRHE